VNQKEKDDISRKIKKALDNKEVQNIDLESFKIDTYENDLFSMSCITGINIITLMMLIYFIS
jgi:hypothetical protein